MEHLERIVENLFGRLDGPLHFRFIFQPLMAMILAILDGRKDAKAGKCAYFWSIVSDSKHRKELLKDGWKRVGKVFIIAMILDVIYQLKVSGRVYPGETLIVAFALAIVPYVVLRGPINRLTRLCTRNPGKPDEVRP